MALFKKKETKASFGDAEPVPEKPAETEAPSEDLPPLTEEELEQLALLSQESFVKEA